MKKLVMLLVAAVLACAAQAAYVNWTAGSLSDYKSQSYYLFDSSKSADVLAALGSVDGNTAQTLAGMAISTGSVSTKGKITASGINVGDTTSIMALVLEGAIADGVGYVTITEDVTKMLYTPPATAPGNFASALATAGTKGTMSSGTPTPPTPGDVPEPTSGLLLLVGGAMLALRRKQK